MSATYQAITATKQVRVGGGRLKGIFCSAASSTPTLAVYDSADADNGDPVILATFTPVAGTYYGPFTGDSGGVNFSNGLYAVIGNTVTVTFFYEP